MRKRKPFEGDINDIANAIKHSASSAESRRIQCVYFAILHPEKTAAQIGKMTLYSTHQVKTIHKKYRNGGLDALADNRGGRYREHLTIDQERELLTPFEQQCRNGSMVVASEVKKAYEQKVGTEVAESTIYRMLDRQGFRKIVPYRRHQKADKQVQEVFKKTSQI